MEVGGEGERLLQYQVPPLVVRSLGKGVEKRGLGARGWEEGGDGVGRRF